MKSQRILAVGVSCTIVLGFAAGALAAPPWQSLIPFKKRVEADDSKSYELTDRHGPWLILAATFTSEAALSEAHSLALEIRSRYNLPAYVHMQDYDYTEPVEGRGVDKYGNPKRMRYINAARYTGYAVLVGDFESFEDPQGQKALETIKHAMPQSLNQDTGKWTVQRWKVYQEVRRRLNVSDERDRKGPMGSAFITRNPLLPEEYFHGGGLDSFVVKMNDGVQHSLLKNRGRYTVQVATFGGETTMDLKQIDKLARSRKVSDKLEVAADAAHRLTLALRQRGVEAYEFHDRYASIVTIGSFDSYEASGPDGETQWRSEIRQIIKQYGAQQSPLPGQRQVGLVPKEVDGIKLDVQPLVVEVPRKSIGSAYARTGAER